MTTISERIKAIIDNEGISKRNFEQQIGCSNGVISKAIANNTDINSIWLTRIVENFPQYDVEWLVAGNGEMLKKVPEHVSEPSIDYVISRDKEHAELLKLIHQKLSYQDHEMTFVKLEIERINKLLEKLISTHNY